MLSSEHLSHSEYPSYADQFQCALEAVNIHSPTAFSWFGRRMDEPAVGVRSHLEPAAARHWLRYFIQTQLYRDFYCQGRAMPSFQRPNVASRITASSFVAQLSAANSGKGFWSTGWRVSNCREGGLEAIKDGLRLHFPLEACRLPAREIARPGTAIEVLHPKELLAASPGFYLALGNHPLVAAAGDCLLRTYWHLSAVAAPRFVATATDCLNRENVAFRLKVVSNPNEFFRFDAAVLYLLRSDMDRVWPVLAELHASVFPHLSPGAPALTKPLAPGVAIAEDPGGGESFGMHRCGLIADALLLFTQRGGDSAGNRSTVLQEVFSGQGLDPDAPYLNTGSEDRYRPLPRPSRNPRSRSNARIPPPIETAIGVARRLVRDAIWSDGRCNWIGAAGSVEGTAVGTPIFRNLGVDLYSGTSGVALFLAELYGVTGDASCKKTSEGALRQALARAHQVPPAVRIGLFSGWAGIAYALVRAALLLEEERLFAEAVTLIRSLIAERDPITEEPDLIAGKAGAIVGLLSLASGHAIPGCLDLAVSIGGELMALAEHSESGFSWRSPRFPGCRNLTGFSHGAAGVGFALMQLFAATGDRGCSTAASEGFRYERSYFDSARGNWPDFREDRNKRRKSGGHLFPVAWCHGAAGIGLSRLRAWEITRDPGYRRELEVAVSTTSSMIRSSLSAGTGSYCLCHGLAGNAELLRCASSVPEEAPPVDRSLIDQVAELGVRRHGGTVPDFPSGAPGYTPSLMTGLAGVGYFYLTLAQPDVPSILALNPRQHKRI